MFKSFLFFWGGVGGGRGRGVPVSDNVKKKEKNLDHCCYFEQCGFE